MIVGAIFLFCNKEMRSPLNASPFLIRQELSRNEHYS